MSLSITGKTAIVTGAAKGIGLAVARHFQAKGANVMFVDIDEDSLDAELGAEARAEGSVRMFTGDLRQKLTIANLLSATIDAFDRVDILVNASRRMAVSDPLNVEDDAVEMLWQENVMTSLRLSQMTAKRMIAQAEKAQAEGLIGAIINISSIAGCQTQPGLLGYSIASAAVDQMTRSMAVALAPKGIRVNAVAIGSVMSASLQTVLKDTPEWRDAIVNGTPLGRIAAPDELAEVMQFLASDASGFMTGQVLRVDGGRSLLDRVVIPAY
ncbi:MAG: SDR family oxidoreductase [Pseudotabrizicola sp.]|uniref:SDR family NAD(P)-dependent oxidoreductase n=1 Tax=Pseudotabrizicola sp. TaxID=2939647 RepID=UPI00272480C9|nr:SDR family oxidoreductase [Pseudotabrizicola sp.]MDO9639447.1 SDR family oxidoreductase [Pseudotabrizicola sp.]